MHAVSLRIIKTCQKRKKTLRAGEDKIAIHTSAFSALSRPGGRGVATEKGRGVSQPHKPHTKGQPCLTILYTSLDFHNFRTTVDVMNNPRKSIIAGDTFTSATVQIQEACTEMSSLFPQGSIPFFPITKAGSQALSLNPT